MAEHLLCEAWQWRVDSRDVSAMVNGCLHVERGTVQNTTIGILAIQVFAPRNAGDALLIAASDALRAAFERRSFGDGIRFRESLGPNDTAFEQQWAGRAFLFPFEFIEDIAL